MSENKHSHHHRHRRKSRWRSFLYCLMSFFLSLTLSLLSLCAVLALTVFSEDYMLKAMNTSDYSNTVKYELKTYMTDLVYASGFEESFASSFTDSYNIQKAIENYIESFYGGDKSIVDTTAFKQQLYAAVQNYITEKNLDENTVASDGITYFINEAADIYSDQIAIPFFSVIGKYIESTRTSLSVAIGVLTVMVLGIAAVIFFTNRFKHRRYRYLCYGLLGGALTTAVLPTFILLSGKIGQVNLETRSLYHLFVEYCSGICYAFYIPVFILLALAAVTFGMYVKYYSKYRNANP